MMLTRPSAVRGRSRAAVGPAGVAGSGRGSRMTEQPETSATYEVHGIDEEPTLTWTAGTPASDEEDDGPEAA